MIRFTGLIAIVLLAASAFTFGREDATLKDLIDRAEAAPVDHKPGLFMDVADREMKMASDAMKSEHSDELRTDLDNLVQYCDKAKSAALQSNKHIKNVEIRLRRISTQLRNIKLDADPDDQPKVQTTIDQLENFRTELLRKMFGGKS